MGMQFVFTCPACGYEVYSSGGRDRGIDVSVQTISCRECKKLHDVVVLEGLQTGKPKKKKPVCPWNKSHTVSPWEHPGPCPQCGATLEQGEAERLWD